MSLKKISDLIFEKDRSTPVGPQPGLPQQPTEKKLSDRLKKIRDSLILDDSSDPYSPIQHRTNKTRPGETSSNSPLQDHINKLKAGATLDLGPGGEFEGPILLSKPIILQGSNGCTIHARTGPVISISCDDVTLRGLRIEVSDPCAVKTPRDNLAMFVAPSVKVKCDEVHVIGNVEGLGDEDGPWQFPGMIDKIDFVPNATNKYRMRLFVPVACHASTHISGLVIAPTELKPGLNDVELVLASIPAGVSICGELEIRSGSLIRSITIIGRATESASVRTSNERGEELLWKPTEQIPAPSKTPEPVLSALPPSPPAVPTQAPTKKTRQTTLESPGELEMQLEEVQKIVHAKIGSANLLSETEEEQVLAELVGNRSMARDFAKNLVRLVLDRIQVTSEEGLREEVSFLVKVLVNADKDKVLRLNDYTVAVNYLQEPRFKTRCYSRTQAEALVKRVLDSQGYKYETTRKKTGPFIVRDQIVVVTPGSKSTNP